jgi:hypothetical protein
MSVRHLLGLGLIGLAVALLAYDLVTGLSGAGLDV